MTNIPQKIQDRLLELDGMITHIDDECARLTDEVSNKIADMRETQAGMVQERDVLEFAVGEYERAVSQAAPLSLSPTPVFDALVARQKTPSGESTLPVLITGLLAQRSMTAKEMFADISKVRAVTLGGVAGTMSVMSRRGEIVKRADGWALAR